jgi:NHLM bacteriocin system ABC transporter ATP-binding protein
VVDATIGASLEEHGFEFYRPSPGTPLGLLDLGHMALAEARGDIGRLLWAALGSGLLGLVLPLATSKVFSDIIPMAVPANIVPLLATLISFTLASTFFDLTRAMALIRIEGRTNSALQSTIIDRLLALPVPFFRLYSIGDLTLRAGAINTVRDLLSGAVLAVIIEGAVSIVNLALLFYYSPMLSLVAVATLLISILFTSAFAIVSLRFERRRQAADGAVAGLVFEMITAIAKLRVAGAERRAFAVWTKLFREERQLAFRVGRYENVVAVFNEVLPIFSRMALLGTTGYLMTSSTALDTGNFVAFYAAFGAFLAAGIDLNSTLIGSLNIIPMMERAQPILEATLESPETKPDPGELRGHIEVSHVSFRHRADGPLILRDVNIQAKPGEFIALLGPSGAGKSTVLRLLLGFDAPETGAIYFDQQDLATVDLTAVRAQMGVVLQSSKLLAGDIFQNIVGSAPLTIDDAWEAAAMAGLDEDIDEMPMGMHTVLSEGATTLSGGQRQRLLIARALVRKPRIVLFDEATSALDNRTQEIVSQSLENLKVTRIVIAHRLSTVRNADRLYVMDTGQVVQHGTYDELAQVPGLFARMVARQLA